MKKAWVFDVKLYVLFIDLRKASDSVPSCILWRCLTEYGGYYQLLRTVKGIYKARVSKVNARFFK